MEQVDELHVLIYILKDLKVDVYKSLQVATILVKLSVTWNDYGKKLLHSFDNFNVD